MKRISYLVLTILILISQGSYAVDFKGSLGEGKLTRYVPPVSNPLFNESPYITTEIRPIYLHNRIPQNFVTQGGTIDILAAEIRVALNDRWAIIATKDGYADLQFDAVLPDETGWANLSLGVKYAVFYDPADNTILTIGAEYEAPTGSLKTGGVSMQGGGDGFLDMFVSGARNYGRWGLQGNLGYNLAIDGDHDSSMFHASAHLDYMVTEDFFPMIELNTFSVTNNGDRLPFDFEGLDLVNFGNRDAGTVTTMALGARFILSDKISLGTAYEFPISSRKDIIDWRSYVDLVITF